MLMPPILQIGNPYVYAPVNGSKITAGHGEFKNLSKLPAKISVISMQGFKSAEMHETAED